MTSVQRALAWKKRLKKVATIVFERLGPYHSESVYQRAMTAEIQADPYINVNIFTEVQLPIYYQPSNSNTPVVVGSCRLDIVLVLGNGERIVLELKVMSGQQKKTMQQVTKYKSLSRRLCAPFCGFISRQ